MVLSLHQLAWLPASRLVRASDPQMAHARTLAVMRLADRSGPLAALAHAVNRVAFPDQPTRVGGVTLPHAIILAAGLVKGDGFATEATALAAVADGRDIVPGWRSASALMGAVEFGSYTCHPRLGNGGRVLWRSHASRSMQNRVGLRNPGARAAARHLRSVASRLPRTFGINLAASPGVDDPAEAAHEVREAARAFEEAFAAGVRAPSWYTLNLSCPNTGDDPHGLQSEALARCLAGVLCETVPGPVWVKIGPDLSDEQLEGLVTAFADVGVAAVVATNTVARPVPGDGTLRAGLSGAELRPLALDTVARLAGIVARRGAPIDIIGCGGILDGADLRAFQAAGARAAMIYSALVFRGPLAGALILHEAGSRPDA
jgi:dihydroorotate dehydrogenase